MVVPRRRDQIAHGSSWIGGGQPIDQIVFISIRRQQRRCALSAQHRLVPDIAGQPCIHDRDVLPPAANQAIIPQSKGMRICMCNQDCVARESWQDTLREGRRLAILAQIVLTPSPHKQRDNDQAGCCRYRSSPHTTGQFREHFRQADSQIAGRQNP